ncbi:MAG: PP2C family serine/threonine-protein phosphatase [Byssovorax sp.]
MTEPPRSRPRIRPIVAGLSDVGRQRKHNEDHVLIKPEQRLFAVADGMGGHNAGDVASKLTTTSLGNFFEATAGGDTPIELPDEYKDLPPAARRLVAGVRKANLDVFVISNTIQQHHGMGSTIVATHFGEDGLMHIAHVGDSRCYRIRDGAIKQLTRDHSLINDALELKPDLAPEELARLPRNIITRALGMKDVVKVDIKSDATQPGDLYLLCSDGLSGMVPDPQILEVMSLTEDPQEACELLIAEANDAGGTDNISALIVRFVEDLPESDAMPEMEAHEILDDVETESQPVLEAAESVVDEVEEDELSAEEAAALAEEGEPSLDLRGPWSGKRVAPKRCTSCKAELLAGNYFCVECGAPIPDDDVVEG